MSKKEPTTAFGWLDEIENVISNARREVRFCAEKVKDLSGVEVDFVDADGNSIMGVRNFVKVDERGDMTILLDRMPDVIAAIKIAQNGK